MSYEIDIDPAAEQDIAALPTVALPALAEAMTVLTPGNGRPINPDNPAAPARTLAFGDGRLLTYLVLERKQRIDVLIVARRR
ncbi:MAG: hypothetical protein M3Z25_07405 [Actinomycetota bacterium]|nr:hypothetical protein [Actinomycetota bacterium]